MKLVTNHNFVLLPLYFSAKYYLKLEWIDYGNEAKTGSPLMRNYHNNSRERLTITGIVFTAFNGNRYEYPESPGRVFLIN